MSGRRRDVPESVRQNAGRVWQNHEKRSDRSPDYTGRIRVDRPGEFLASMWYDPPRREGQKPSYGIRLEPAEEAEARRASRAAEAPPERREEPTPQIDFDDEIPF